MNTKQADKVRSDKYIASLAIHPNKALQLVDEVTQKLAVTESGKAPGCQFVGCPNTAKRKLTQTVGKGQTLLVCNAHLPVWAAKNGKGSPFYKVSAQTQPATCTNR